MKFITSICYSDETDNYDRYYFNKDIPFVASSLEEAKQLVHNAVEANTKREELDEDFDFSSSAVYDPVVRHTVFGHSFGEIKEGQKLTVDVMTLDDWFEKNQKTVDCKGY